MRHRWLLSVLLVSASGVLQAQSTDSTLVTKAKVNLDSVGRAINQYCHTQAARGYVCNTQRNLTAAGTAIDSILKNPRDSILVVRTDTVIKHDTIGKPDSVIAGTPDTTSGPPPGGAIWVHPFSPLSIGAVFAEFPKDSVSVKVPAPTRTINVVSLQAALDTAQTGDRLLIPRQHKTLSLHVRPTSRASWVTVQGTDTTSVISTVTGGSEASVIVEPKAHHVRFLGPLKITTDVNANALFRSQNNETALDQFPHHIILDNVDIVVPTNLEARRCAWPDGAYMAIVNSRLRGCATKSGDAQAIIILNGPGPYRFENNYLEGSHQCFMSGGGDPSVPGLIPSDIYFGHNVCFKPLWWHYVGSPGNYPDSARQVKTILETKNVRRLLAEYNVFRNVWGDAQVGFGALLKSENQNGTAPWTQTVDVTLRYNRFVNVANGINLSAMQGNPGVPMARVSIYGNIIDSISTNSNEGIGFQSLNNHSDVVIMHNTVTGAGNSAMQFDGAYPSRLTIIGNTFKNGLYGFKGNSSPTGNGTLNKWVFPTGLFLSNLIDSTDCSVYPATTICSPVSPLPKAPDGDTIGADLTKIPK
jgi:hypothetical protein